MKVTYERQLIDQFVMRRARLRRLTRSAATALPIDERDRPRLVVGNVGGGFVLQSGCVKTAQDRRSPAEPYQGMADFAQSLV